MKIKLIITICLLGVGFTSECQELFSKSKITDDRDGRIYKTVQINNTIWIAENMKFKTENSDIILENDLGIETDGYYYPYNESDEVCPSGFEIPKEAHWKEYVDFILKIKNIPESSTKHSSFSSRKVTGTSFRILNDTFNYFEDSNPLNLQKSGMTQGGKLIFDQAMNFWSRKDNLNDSKYHLHITQNEYGNHSHKHHVITRKNKKRRKFVVRCVKIIGQN